MTAITWNGVLAACVGAKGRVWELIVGAPSGGGTGQISFVVYDRFTGAGTTTTVDSGDNWGTIHFYAVTFTQATWAVYRDGDFLANGSCDFANIYNGFAFNGLNVPWQGLSGNCFNGVIQDIALYPATEPQARIVATYNVSLNAEPDELDTSRIARVTGYGGFTPPLAMLGLSGLWPEADIDPVTPITDTLGQVVSSYITNIASSTLAALFTDGTGALVYRRRLEWYDRAIGQWAVGENAPAALNVNPWFSTSVTSWTAANATLTYATRQGQFTGRRGRTHRQRRRRRHPHPRKPARNTGAVVFVHDRGHRPRRVRHGRVREDHVAELVPVGDLHGIREHPAPGCRGVDGADRDRAGPGREPRTSPCSFDTSGTPSNGTVFYVSSVVTAVYPGEAPYLRDEKLRTTGRSCSTPRS